MAFAAIRLGRWKWEMGNGKWEMGNGKWEMGNGKWEMGNFGIRLWRREASLLELEALAQLAVLLAGY